MKNLNCVSLMSDPKSKLGFCKLFIAATLICGVYFIASALVAKDYKENDLIHEWGLDMQLGYCAQGDRTKIIVVVDSEYIVHLGLPTLGVLDDNEAPSESQRVDNRSAVRRQSYVEMQIFKKIWNKAAKEDECWVDPYQHTTNNSNH